MIHAIPSVLFVFFPSCGTSFHHQDQTKSGAMLCFTSKSYFLANSKSLSSCAGTAITAQVP